MIGLKQFWYSFSFIEKCLLGILGVIYFHNLFIDIMEVDAMQYADMSKQMVKTGNILQIYDSGQDYLDKPPLLFWLSALSLKLFGFHNWSYKLPSVIFLCISLYALFRFAIIYYSHELAKASVLIFATCQAFILMTNDVKTDGLLISFVIIGLWLFSEFFKYRQFYNFILASVAVSLAMMTKGPIGFIAVLLPIGFQLMITGKWSDIFHWRWSIMFSIILVLLFPMLWGLYHQFDLHPEKEVYGLHGPSGIKFFFWTQSFGRVTGDIYWSNGLPWHFFITSILWDYFPWVIFLYPAVYFHFKKWKTLPEYVSITGFISLFVMLSSSKFKLPHYIFITFPMASVLCAYYISQLSESLRNKYLVGIKILASIILLVYWVWSIDFFPPVHLGFVVIWILAVWGYSLSLKNNRKQSLIVRTAFFFIGIPLFLSFIFYPTLLKFQVNSQLGQYLQNNTQSTDTTYSLSYFSHGVDFYDDRPFKVHWRMPEFGNVKHCFVVVRPSRIRHINDGSRFEILKTFQGFKISTLNLSVLRAATRSESMNDSLYYCEMWR